MTVDPTGRFAYVISLRHVSAYTIVAETGGLELVPDSTLTTGIWPRSVAVDPTGQFVYVVNEGSRTSRRTGLTPRLAR